MRLVLIILAGCLSMLAATTPSQASDGQSDGRAPNPVVVLASGVQTYIYERDGKPGGPVYDVLKCILDTHQIPHRIDFMPLTRTVRYFTDEKADIVVPAVKGQRFAGFADWVGPFAVSQSFWFYRATGPRAYGTFDLKTEGRVGTKRLSAWRTYLERNGYTIGRFAETVEDGMALLLAGEVDALLGSDTHRAPGAIAEPLMENIKAVPAFDVVFGGYFRHSFFSRFSLGKDRLTKTVQDCRPAEAR